MDNKDLGRIGSDEPTGLSSADADRAPAGLAPDGLQSHCAFTPGPWHVCQHLKGITEDRACSCGYRGVIYGPEHDIAYAVCQPGHDPAPKGQEGSEPARYPREVEIANAHLIAAAPDLYEALAAATRAWGNEAEEISAHRKARAALAKAEGRP